MTANVDSAVSLQPGGSLQFPRDSLVQMTDAGDEGEGFAQPPSARPPGPRLSGAQVEKPALWSMVRLIPAVLLSPSEMLRCIQPRDSHIHGAPHARAEPSAHLRQYERGVCARRTATKYRNTTTATRHPSGLSTAPSCSVANMVAVAGSSGRRGRRFKSCRPDQCFLRSQAASWVDSGPRVDHSCACVVEFRPRRQ